MVKPKSSVISKKKNYSKGRICFEISNRFRFMLNSMPTVTSMKNARCYRDPVYVFYYALEGCSALGVPRLDLRSQRRVFRVPAGDQQLTVAEVLTLSLSDIQLDVSELPFFYTTTRIDRADYDTITAAIQSLYRSIDDGKLRLILNIT